MSCVLLTQVQENSAGQSSKPVSALDDILSGLGSLTCSQVKGSLVPDKPPKTYPPGHLWQIESKTDVSWRRTSRVKSSNANWLMEKISRTCRYRTQFFFFQKSGIICQPTGENSPWLHLKVRRPSQNLSVTVICTGYLYLLCIDPHTGLINFEGIW